METKLKVTLLAALLILVFSLSVISGSVKLDPGNAFLPGTSDYIILFSIRLPRVIAAFLAGLAFSVSGLLIQSATSNDLASPNIIGINSGAGFSVLIFLVFFPSRLFALPFAAFFGAMLSAALVFLISSLSVRLSSRSSLILSGVAVNALFNAGISTLGALKPDVMGSYSSFSIGGFSSVYARELIAPSIIILVSSGFALSLSPLLSALRLGDEISSSMGYRPKRIRIILILLGSLLASSAVTFSGLLGFVGLVTPHAASFLSGGKIRHTMAYSMLIGPILVMLADLISRTVIAPSELPAGIFMAIIGVPFFIFLLLRRSHD